MSSSEPMQRCENCSQLFPESKINSHFSYCRRNIKKCPKCTMMVDINYQEDHDQEFHTTKPCQFCKKQLKGDELSQHEKTCKSKPKYCQYCQLNIAVSQYDKHIVSCGSRTNTCPKCEKHIMLKDFTIHQVQCKGKVVQPPQPVNNNAFKKRQVREDPLLNDPNIRYPVQPQRNISNVPNVHPSYRGVPSSNGLREQYRRQQPRRQQPRRQQPRRQQPKRQQPRRKQQTRVEPSYSNNTYGYAQKTYERPSNIANERNPGSINSRNIPTTNIQPHRNIYKKQQYQKYYNNQIPSKKEQIKYSVPTNKIQTNHQKLYREQKQHLKKSEQQRQQKRTQQKPNPIYVPNESDYANFDLDNEELELQRILMETAENKVKNYKGFGGYEDLGMEHMTQSFYRDVQQQKQIQSKIKKDVPARRR